MGRGLREEAQKQLRPAVANLMEGLKLLAARKKIENFNTRIFLRDFRIASLGSFRGPELPILVRY